jgi:glycosyltransferase involved in cell wall biosynthesis
VVGDKILFVCSGLNIGGAERQWSQLIPALRDRGYNVTVLTLVDEGPFFEELRLRGIDVRCARMRHRLDVVGLIWALRQGELRPAVVVTHSTNAHVVGHLIARKVGSPHVTTEHLGDGPGTPRARHREALTRMVGPRVDCAIAISRRQVPKLLKLGYRRDRIRIIQNGVPEIVASTSASSVRSRLGVERDAFFAVLVATLRPEKDPATFVRAVQLANKNEPRVRGIIVGGGPEFDHVKALVGEGTIVRMAGPRSDVPDILQAANVLCLSSTAEGLPMVILEAMAAGKPIVATEIGGVPEAVQNDRTGILVPVGDAQAFAAALVRLAGDAELAARMGQAGRERHRTQFSFERMIDEYADVLDEMLATPTSTNVATSVR